VTNQRSLSSLGALLLTSIPSDISHPLVPASTTSTSLWSSTSTNGIPSTTARIPSTTARIPPTAAVRRSTTDDPHSDEATTSQGEARVLWTLVREQLSLARQREWFGILTSPFPFPFLSPHLT